MSGIIAKPFRGYVPPANLISDIIAPPYDVLNRAEALEMGNSKPKCVIHITRPEIELPNLDNTHPDVYQRSKDNLTKWITDNLLVKQGKPAYYVYRQKLGEHVQVGVFALASCAQYEANQIKKHEHTRAAPELDRTITTRTQNANVGSVFLAYRGSKYPNLRDYIRSLASGTPDRVAHLDFDNTEHELWIIDDDERVQKIKSLFNEVDSLYIADGHHRCASAYNVYKERKEAAGASHTGNEAYNFFMAAIFAESELCVIDYNRVIKNVTLPTDQLIDQFTKQGFTLTEFTGQEKPATPSFLPFHFARSTEHKTFSLYARGKWYKMVFTGKLKSDKPVDDIDSKILTDFILIPVFDIVDLRTHPNISFIGGTRGLKALEQACTEEDHIAIAVPPITMQQLFDVSDSGDMMPPKSTWFVPKLATGMVVRMIEED